VTSLELTAAYTALYGGKRKEPVSYHRVLDRDGTVLLENKPEEIQVLSPETAAILTRLLMMVNTDGTAARYLKEIPTLGIETAGKTGTTQGNCDRRYIGMTPRLLAGVWMGYDYPTELKGIGGNPCVTVWDQLMAACEQAYRGAPQRSHFDLPETVTEQEFCPLSGCIPNSYCTDPIYGQPTERGWFKQGAELQSSCPLHKEPPIRVTPEDKNEPDRIPLLPNDLLPEDPAPQDPSNTPPPPWYSRWFKRFSRG
jgi:penicillin-binding protein 1A